MTVIEGLNPGTLYYVQVLGVRYPVPCAARFYTQDPGGMGDMDLKVLRWRYSVPMIATSSMVKEAVKPKTTANSPMLSVLRAAIQAAGEVALGLKADDEEDDGVGPPGSSAMGSGKKKDVFHTSVAALEDLWRQVQPPPQSSTVMVHTCPQLDPRGWVPPEEGPEGQKATLGPLLIERAVKYFFTSLEQGRAEDIQEESSQEEDAEEYDEGKLDVVPEEASGATASTLAPTLSSLHHKKNQHRHNVDTLTLLIEDVYGRLLTAYESNWNFSAMPHILAHASHIMLPTAPVAKSYASSTLGLVVEQVNLALFARFQAVLWAVPVSPLYRTPSLHPNAAQPANAKPTGYGRSNTGNEMMVEVLAAHNGIPLVTGTCLNGVGVLSFSATALTHLSSDLLCQDIAQWLSLAHISVCIAISSGSLVEAFPDVATLLLEWKEQVMLPCSHRLIVHGLHGCRVQSDRHQLALISGTSPHGVPALAW